MNESYIESFTIIQIGNDKVTWPVYHFDKDGNFLYMEEQKIVLRKEPKDDAYHKA